MIACQQTSAPLSFRLFSSNSKNNNSNNNAKIMKLLKDNPRVLEKMQTLSRHVVDAGLIDPK